MEFDPTKHIPIADHVNALRLQQVEFDRTLDGLRSEKESAEAKASHLAAIEAAIADEKLDDAATKAAIEATIADSKIPAEDKRKAAIRDQIAKLQLELAEDK